MKLEDLGYNEFFANHRNEMDLSSFGIGRVVTEHRERYVVRTDEKEYDSEIIGNLRFSAQSRADFPAVGDWVAISEYDENKALIHAVLPRKSVIERQAVGKEGDKQIIATNIDYALIVQAVDRDFNINRLERYLAICHASKVQAIIVLNKTDLIDDEQLSILMKRVKQRIKQIAIIPISNETKNGIESLKELIHEGKTYCLLGSSGVGKSTLSNILSGQQLMKTNAISTSTNKGRHVTSHRELLLLENGGIIIDNPGMREVGITESSEGIDKTFEDVMILSKECKFKDCTHISEIQCAVLQAIENGELDPLTYENYLKMEREKDHFESTIAERRKKDKDFGKMIKQFKNVKKSNRSH